MLLTQPPLTLWEGESYPVTSVCDRISAPLLVFTDSAPTECLIPNGNSSPQGRSRNPQTLQGQQRGGHMTVHAGKGTGTGRGGGGRFGPPFTLC